MPRLILLRHAQAEAGAGSSGDADRRLTARGRVDARRMGRFLAAAGEAPGAIISSSAARARETCELAREGASWTCPFDATERLYDANPGSVLDLLRERSGDASDLLLVGHQPTWSELAGRLAGGAAIAMPPGAAAGIDLRASTWGKIELGQGVLVWLLTPKMLPRR